MSDHAPRSIAEYLQQLEHALAGEDPAVLQDALYDAEEYLRAEVAQHPDQQEGDVLERIASTYGNPEEVAEAYRRTEATVAAALATPRTRTFESPLGRLFGVLTDPKAYTALFYMLLALVTGIVYFTVTVTGLSMSVGLMVLIIGIPFFLLFLGVVRVLSLVEGRLVETLLGQRMPRRPPYTRTARPFLERIKELVTDARTWTTMLYLLLQLPLGIVYFTIAVTGIAVSLALIAAPILHLLVAIGLVQADVSFEPGMPVFLEPLVLLAGVVLLPAVMHLFKGIGHVHAQIAKSLLVKPAPAA